MVLKRNIRIMKNKSVTITNRVKLVLTFLGRTKFPNRYGNITYRSKDIEQVFPISVFVAGKGSGNSSGD